jgi:mRNA interferase RelE/StbE
VAAYRVLITRSAEKEIEHLPDGVRRLVVRRIVALADEPRPQGSQKLSGEDKYRIRQGDYRIVYTIEDVIVTVTVVRVAHRSDVYRQGTKPTAARLRRG